MSKKYYFISDLHLGGDNEIDKCEFEDELIIFLKKLSKKKNSELLIVGDMFGFWELTTVDEDKKLEFIIAKHKKLFDQFMQTGKKIKITLIPGNHDQSLMYDKAAVDILARYSIALEKCEAITRKLGSKKIWIEHGSQYDDFNRFDDFAKKTSRPFGYFIASSVVGSSTKYSSNGKSPWIADVASIYPNEDVPNWAYSNYFYREMSPYLRLIIVPFVILLLISTVFGVGVLLNKIHLINSALITPQVFSNIFFVGGFLERLFTIMTLILAVFVAAMIPIYFIIRDVKQALKRYGLKTSYSLQAIKAREYNMAVKRLFRKEKDVKIFVYGHSHAASLKKIGSNYLVNTGTWLKRLKRIKARIRFLPSIYYPSYRLNYFKIYEEKPGLGVIEYNKIEKDTEHGLTWLQRWLIFGRKVDDGVKVPKRVEFRV